MRDINVVMSLSDNLKTIFAICVNPFIKFHCLSKNNHIINDNNVRNIYVCCKELIADTYKIHSGHV